MKKVLPFMLLAALTLFGCADNDLDTPNNPNNSDKASGDKTSQSAQQSASGDQSSTAPEKSQTSAEMSGKDPWWEENDISKVNKTIDGQNNSAGAACDEKTFRQSCNSETKTITFCENGTVGTVDCSKQFEGCAYFPELNWADCVSDIYRCSGEGSTYQGCAHDNDNYLIYSNDYCAKSEEDQFYWVESNVYCAGKCDDNKGCPVEICNVSKYAHSCKDGMGSECYKDNVVSLDCGYMAMSCQVGASGPECVGGGE